MKLTLLGRIGKFFFSRNCRLHRDSMLESKAIELVYSYSCTPHPEPNLANFMRRHYPDDFGSLGKLLEDMHKTLLMDDGATRCWRGLAPIIILATSDVFCLFMFNIKPRSLYRMEKVSCSCRVWSKSNGQEIFSVDFYVVDGDCLYITDVYTLQGLDQVKAIVQRALDEAEEKYQEEKKALEKLYQERCVPPKE